MLSCLILFFPLLATITLFLFKNESVKKVALAISLAELVFALYAVSGFVPDASIQFVADLPWISSLGINFTVGMDGISLLMVLLTTFLTPIIILSSFGRQYTNPKAFYALILVMETGLNGVFMAQNAFLFYIFWELALIPVYFISALWGGEKRIQVTLKFFIYTILGSLFMLIAFIYLYFQSPSHQLDFQTLYSLDLDRTTQGWLFWAFFLAFAIKMPVFPFHTWQPDTYTESPAPASMLLAGIMLKMGVYGVIRWILPMLPLGWQDWANVAIILSIIGIVYASCIAIVQKDIKRLIAYSSIAHVGLISAGIFSLNIQGIQGGVIQMLSHGLTVVGLFYVADIITARTGKSSLEEMGGLTDKAPRLAVFFMIIMLGSVALPLTSGFIGEFLLLAGVYEYNSWMAAIAGLTIILGSVYMLNMYKKAMFGTPAGSSGGFTDLTIAEHAGLIPIVIMIFWIGIYPETFFQIARPAIENLVELAGRNSTQIVNLK